MRNIPWQLMMSCHYGRFGDDKTWDEVMNESYYKNCSRTRFSGTEALTYLRELAR